MNVWDALDATWPAAERVERDGWTLRRGAGGGQRVSAATRTDPGADIAAAEAAMAVWGQPPLFQVRDDDAALASDLAAAGYVVHDPVSIYSAPAADLIDGISEMSRIYRCEGPVAAMREIWAEGGIGPDRLTVMDRAEGPKTWLMARLADRPAAVAFVSAPGPVAMIHAIETAPSKRRNGMAAALLSGAASFAEANGAATLALAVTKANEPANALYAKLGMTVVAEYHYRRKP